MLMKSVPQINLKNAFEESLLGPNELFCAESTLQNSYVYWAIIIPIMQ